MARLEIAVTVAIAAAAAAGAARGDPPGSAAAGTSARAEIARLESALPAGWSLLATGSELVIRHDRPCYVTDVHHDHAPAGVARSVAPAGGGPLVTIELRYRLEPRWTAPQLAAARATNEGIAGQIRALAARYRIAAIRTAKGQPIPANADEQARLDAYEAARARLAARRVQVPHCTLGELSVFDGEDTYAQLALQVDPPEVMTQAHSIVALVNQRCR